MDKQTCKYANYDYFLQEKVADGTLPAAVLHIRMGNQFQFQRAYGSWNTSESRASAELNTIFDLASLTKVTTTLPAVLQLATNHKLDLDAPVQHYMPKFRHSEVKLIHLLLHSSGLPGDLGPFSRDDHISNLMELILEQELLRPVHTAVTYSDLGMILLSHIVSLVSGMDYASYVQQHILEPLEMHDTCFNPPAALKPRIAATEMVNGQYVHGLVHDEKSYLLGGATGSAGLFSTAADMQRYASQWLQPEHNRLGIAPEWMKCATTETFHQRGLGWEMQTGKHPVSCGALWPIGSFGHTGFTGTSLWINSAQQLSVVLLTNIVHYGRDHTMASLRPELHSLIYSSYAATSS